MLKVYLEKHNLMHFLEDVKLGSMKSNN
jgi:hypothetical protein